MFWEEHEKDKHSEEDYIKPIKSSLNPNRATKTQCARPIAEIVEIEMDYVEDEMTIIENSYMEGESIYFYNERRVW